MGDPHPDRMDDRRLRAQRSRHGHRRGYDLWFASTVIGPALASIDSITNSIDPVASRHLSRGSERLQHSYVNSAADRMQPRCQATLTARRRPMTHEHAARPAPAISSRTSASAQIIRHATPRTVTAGDVALYNGLFGPRFAVQSSDAFAQAIGYPRAPVDDLLVFHIVFGKTVPDISLNAVANLGYAACRFLAPVYPGDTLNAVSEVIGLKENSSRKTGIVFVRSTGFKQDGSKVLEYVRWVMVHKRDEAAPAPRDHVPRVPEALLPSMLGDACPPIDVAAYDFDARRQSPSLRRLRGRREDRPCRRRHRRGGRAPDRDAALSEHGAHPFQPVRRRARAASAGG